MNRSKSFFTILGMFLVIGAITWHFYFKSYYAKDTINILETFPQQIDDWNSEDLPITDDEYAILETRNAFVRKYTNTLKEEVYLFIVYSQNNRKVSHPPEICYTGSGVSVSDKSVLTIIPGQPEAVLKGHKLHLHKGKLNEIAFYWFKVGNSFTENYWRQQGMIAVKTLLGQQASSALIRVSTSVIDENEEKTLQLLKKFSQRVLPELKKYLP